MISSVLFIRLPKLVETAVVKDRAATGRRPACPLQRLAHQLSAPNLMNNTEEIMAASQKRRRRPGRCSLHLPRSLSTGPVPETEPDPASAPVTAPAPAPGSQPRPQVRN